jgi:hypothetical protein
MDQMNKASLNVVTMPRKSNISDFDVVVGLEETTNNRKSMLRKSIIRVKKHERSSYLETEMEINAIREQRRLF